MEQNELKEFLDFKADQYENPLFLEHDPIQIPHRFIQKEDIEISAFLIAMLAWGNRKSIINSGNKLMQIMGESPYDFVMNYQSSRIETKFVHRTFNSGDLDFFLQSLKNIYQHKGGLEQAFNPMREKNCKVRIEHFRKNFMEIHHDIRSEKHLSNPQKNSACKRIVMFLRWMVRDEKKGVDFGLWKSISTSELYIPLDVHTATISRKLKMINRIQNDWKTSEELIEICRKFDANDPAKYDFALFGLGAFEKF